MRRTRRNTVRIIGGRWRSRILKFPDAADLRPTPDRVRETLFNWLGQDLTGMACLDLFAGNARLRFAEFPFHRGNQTREVAFHQIIVGPGFHRRDGGVLTNAAGDNDKRQIDSGVLQYLQSGRRVKRR